MPYIETEKVAQMRKEIRAALPDFKVSVTRHHGSTVDVRLMSGPIANIEHVNVFYYKKNLEDRPDAVKVIDTILEIVKRIGQPRELVYDSDYGSVPTFYYDVSFGKWNQPYECTDPDAEDRVEIWKEFNQIRRFEEQEAGRRKFRLVS